MMQTKTKIRQMKRPSRTDWKRVDAMKDFDIDFSDIPELGPDFFANAILWRPRAERDEREADPIVSALFKEVMADVLKVKPPAKSKIEKKSK
jgi:hypothetical protein